jgi:predicted ATPase/DNA-binding SARP family transcriptional activator
VVTFLFTDVEGSTRLWAADRPAMSASLELHDAILRSAIEAAGGYVFTTAGDSFAAAFRRASDAVAAAQKVQTELAAAQWPGPPLRVRMGLHLGEAEERDGDYFGPVVNTAARVEEAGHGGQVLLTDAVRATTDVVAVDLGMHALRHLDEPIRLFQLGDDTFPALRGGATIVRCQVLGPIMVDAKPMPSARQRRLLAGLVMGRGAVVSTDRLLDVVWDGEPPPSPLNALQTYISRLRTTVGSEAVAHRPPGYALVLADDEVDAWRFETLVDQARSRPVSDALTVFDRALELWHGTAYAEFAEAEFARGEAVRLEELRASVEGMRMEALLQLGRHEEVLTESLRLIDVDPYRESVWEQRMRALHAAGRTVDAVRTFHEYRTRLLGEVGLEPSADLAALERALVAGPLAETSEPASGVTLPTPLTSFLGREAAVRAVASASEVHRVVTLVGPGGVGKTRLVVEVARILHGPDGVPTWFVELASHQADDVGSAIARVVGVVDDADLLGALRRRLARERSLLVVDNCEHVLEAVAAVIDGVAPFCPDLRVLATSRMPLGVAGEATWAVPPLDPDAGQRLFRERATTAGVQVDDGAATREAVAAICRAVDGLPLGIELAVAVARSLPLDRVADGLRARTGARPTSAAGRHRSLDAAVAWSHQLLTPVEQILLRRLAVFDGGWTVDAAEAVCGGHGLAVEAVPAALVALETASLTTFDRVAVRYSMLDTIHAFAHARLDESGERDTCRDAHLLWAVGEAARLAPQLGGPDTIAVRARLKVEYPNLRTALRWALGSGDHAAATGLAHDLYDYWSVAEQGYEAISFLQQVLALPGEPSAERVELQVGLSELLSLVGDFAGCVREGDAALASARGLGDRRVLARCLVNSSFGGHLDDRSGMAVEALALAEDLGEDVLAAGALHMLGLLANRAGRSNEAIAFYERSLQTARTSTVYGTRGNLGVAYRNTGRWTDARRQLLLSEHDEADAGGNPAETCMHLALIELCLDDTTAAVRAAERAGVWGRPPDDFAGSQVVFDAVHSLVEVERGDAAGAAAEAGRVATLPVDVSEHGSTCIGWLVAGEVLLRCGEPALARDSFLRVLRHRAGTIPYHQALAFGGIAATVTGDDSARLAEAATALGERYGLVRPPWMTRARFDPVGDSPLSEDEAVTLALSLDTQ